MSSTSNDIAITGANGFVGKNLRSFLHKKKINVLGISRKNFRKHASEVKITSTNLLESKLQTKLKNYDVLVHLIGTGRRSPKSMFEEINLNLTKNVIKACKNAGIKKIIFISGLGVSRSNKSDYFISKYKAEQEIINSGLYYTIFRASYIIGKTDYLTETLSKQRTKGVIIIPGSGKYRLQPISVADVAKIILEAINEKKFSNASNNDVLLADLYKDVILHLPVLKDAKIIARWAGVRPSARKRLPILGKHPVYQGAYIANGGFKIGFSLAPKIAEVMADYILYDIDNIPKTFKV